MALRIIEVASKEQGAGKTHVAAALARLLSLESYHPVGVHLSTRRGDAVACPTGGTITRAAALIAEGCRLLPELHFDPPAEELAKTLEALSAEPFDIAIVETAAGAAPLDGAWRLEVARAGEKLLLTGPWGTDALPLFEPGLMPPADEELDALPLWRLGTGPRVGVVSLPHIDNFADFRLLRGSEWLITPSIGRFDFIFFPATTHAAFDLEWLDEVQLRPFLAQQAASGCRMMATGWSPEGLGYAVERIATGLLADTGFLSRLLGRRYPPPLPDDDVLDSLAAWLGGWPHLAAFHRLALHGENEKGGGSR